MKILKDKVIDNINYIVEEYFNNRPLLDIIEEVKGGNNKSE